MERSKATTFVTKYMNGLWPKWSLTWPLQEDWVTLMLQYDETVAKQAIQQMRRMGKSGGLTYPVQKEFLSCARSISSSLSPVAPTPEANAYLICTELDESGRGLLGMVAWLGWWSTSSQPMGNTEPGRKAIGDYTRAYGGRWSCYCGSGLKAMLKSKEIKEMARDIAAVAEEDEGSERLVDPESWNPNELMEDDELAF